MIILDSPYVSDILKKTITENQISAFCTGDAASLGLENIPLLETGKAVTAIQSNSIPRIYTNSENSIGWISENLSSMEIPEKINLFKNKLLFRKTLEKMHPDFWYKAISYHDLKDFDISSCRVPFILKPVVGFFSMGVYKITSADDWHRAVDDIQLNLHKQKHIYPETVFDSTSFILEEEISGDEYAIDAYFNSKGKPVILNIMKHVFASDRDVSDRVYTTSDDIILNNLAAFSAFLERMGNITGLKNFPCHTEVRINSEGEIYPIEVNPLRFGGWCTTGDLAFLAWGFNPYLYFLDEKEPQWESILQHKNDFLYSIVVLDNSTGIEGKNIASFDYDRLEKYFMHPLELRKIDFRKYPVFGFLFTRTEKNNTEELQGILSSDLKIFINTQF